MKHDALPTDPAAMASVARWRLTVRGTVQGVGFRPFVYREATARGLAGWVRNSPAGVVIEVEGDAAALAALRDAIRRTPPANARITALEVRDLAPRGAAGFRIATSEAGGPRSLQLLPDLATCERCLAELLDPNDRRYRYPFINCIDCGPRYSIIEDLPYDRSRTAMRHFPLCAACRAEYHDPANRRFHAEPNACPACGPRLALWEAAGAVLARDDDALVGAAQAIREGRIVAVKGLGGFHLVADARDAAAVARLRARKRRPDKPFAVMFPSLAAIQACCDVSPAAETLLLSAARPIVLLPYRGGPIAPAVAPGNPRLGALLPYTPLHHLLLRELGFPVVATSGNLGGEPIVTDETLALQRLAGVADAFLVHDRPIVRPLDDSLAQLVGGAPQLLRHARGHAPTSLPVAGIRAGLLAGGGHLKTSVALTRETDVVLGAHLGDLESAAACRAHAAALADLGRLLDATPRLAVGDDHPGYASRRTLERTGLPLVTVPHHLAHVAACLAEHDRAPPALGVAWDGTGLGPDGTIWGGEFLRVSGSGWRRIARLRPFPLPGGEAAVREPRRAALGLLYAAYGERALGMTDLTPLAAFAPGERTILGTLLARGVNAPPTSSMGRLFDACAALLGLCQRSSFEGQAAMRLEWAAHPGTPGAAYAFPLREAAEGAVAELDWRPALDALLADIRAGVDVGSIANAWHRGLAAAIVAAAEHAGERTVVLSGGCFQNTFLTEVAVAALRAGSFEPLWHRRIPPNDGGLALGQAVWAGWMEHAGESPCA